MNSDLQEIFDGKRSLRRELAALPVAEKLRMLDALRERELAIRGQTVSADKTTGSGAEPVSKPAISNAGAAC
jgi:hypothetical protein